MGIPPPCENYQLNDIATKLDSNQPGPIALMTEYKIGLVSELQEHILG